VARASGTDPDAHVIRNGEGGTVPSYNVQLLTDTRHGIVVNVEAFIDAIDYRQLGPAIERCEPMLGRKPKQIVADGDYTNHASVQAPQLVASTFVDRGKTAGSRWTAMRKAAGRRSWPVRFLTLPGGTASLVPPDRSCPIRLCRIARTRPHSPGSRRSRPAPTVRCAGNAPAVSAARMAEAASKNRQAATMAFKTKMRTEAQ
jgi:hypothetical protein